MTYAIEVQNLSKTFHAGAKALDNVSLQVADGEMAVSYTHLTLPTTPYV